MNISINQNYLIVIKAKTYQMLPMCQTICKLLNM